MFARLLVTLGFGLFAGITATAADENPEVEKYVKQLKSFEQTPRTAAIKQLAAMGTEAKSATRPLLEMILNPKMKAPQIAALEAVEKVNPKAYKPARTLILDNGWFERADALKEIDNLNEADREAVLPVVIAAYNLERIKSKGNGFVLNDFFRTFANSYPKEKETQDVFLQAITFVGPQAPASGSRKHALENLPKITIDKKPLYKALMSGMNDGDAGVRALVIAALGNLGADAKAALPILKKLKLDRNQEVREAADTAVKKIEAGK